MLVAANLCWFWKDSAICFACFESVKIAFARAFLSFFFWRKTSTTFFLILFLLEKSSSSASLFRNKEVYTEWKMSYREEDITFFISLLNALVMANFEGHFIKLLSHISEECHHSGLEIENYCNHIFS